MGDTHTKIAKQYGKISEFWTQFHQGLIAAKTATENKDSASSEKKKKKVKDKKKDSPPPSPFESYMAWTAACAEDTSKIFHPEDYGYLAAHLEPAQLQRIVDLVFPSGAPAPASPQHIKGDPSTARFVVVTMRPTKPARLARVSADVQREGFVGELQQAASVIEDAADAIILQLGATADPESIRGLRMDLRDKAAVLSSIPEFAPYGTRAKKGRRLREEQARLLAQLGVDSAAVEAALNAAGLDTEVTKQAVSTFYDGSAWRLLAQAAVLDSHIAGGDDWYGWLNHDRAYQANNSLLHSVRTSGNPQPHAVTFPPEHFAEISIFPYHVDAKFSEIQDLLPPEILANMPSVKLGLKLIKAVAKSSYDRVLILRGPEESSFLLDNVKAVAKAAQKGHVFGYANPASRFTTYNNLVKLHYKQVLVRGDEGDKLSAFATNPNDTAENDVTDVLPQGEGTGVDEESGSAGEVSEVDTERFEFFSKVSAAVIPPHSDDTDKEDDD